ncbi:hypothetical protein M758_UG064400 [Ceratodon purpureus]|nr:hypothetical protein M758_UG064400 [Ceratodon purpureus]
MPNATGALQLITSEAPVLTSTAITPTAPRSTLRRKLPKSVETGEEGQKTLRELSMLPLADDLQKTYEGKPRTSMHGAAKKQRASHPATLPTRTSAERAAREDLAWCTTSTSTASALPQTSTNVSQTLAEPRGMDMEDTYTACFGREEVRMDIDTPTESLRKLLAEKARKSTPNQEASTIKRSREKPSPSSTAPSAPSAPRKRS